MALPQLLSPPVSRAGISECSFQGDHQQSTVSFENINYSAWPKAYLIISLCNGREDLALQVDFVCYLLQVRHDPAHIRPKQPASWTRPHDLWGSRAFAGSRGSGPQTGRAHVLAHVCMCEHMCTHVCTYITHVCLHVFTHALACVCAGVCVCVYTVHIQTNTLGFICVSSIHPSTQEGACVHTLLVCMSVWVHTHTGAAYLYRCKAFAYY